MNHFTCDARDDKIYGRYDQTIQSGIWDIYYDDAAYIAFSYGYATSALLQRKLHVGYFRAQKLLETLGEYGVVCSRATTGARKIKMRWEELKGHLKAVKDMRSRSMFRVIKARASRRENKVA